MLEYEIIRTNRKTAVIEFKSDGRIIFKCGYFFPRKLIDKIIKEKEEILIQKSEKAKKRFEFPDIDIKMKNQIKDELMKKITPRLEYYSSVFGFKYQNVKITTAKKRFGSCSNKNNLCFSVYLYYYPDELIDCVIVHELCHTVHHNHSRRFYEDVMSILPDYKQKEKILKNYKLENFFTK